MRLLRWNDNGEVELAEFSASNEATPPYAILSHTWGADGDEVTFEDLKHGTGKDKPGFKKIWFCGEQARKDSLQYFWIDTCCINKTNYAELSHVIKSMFRWYRNASRCYVYLPDVHSHPFDTSNELHSRPWEPDFRNSRWFTRGWTLQELLAPHSVEFFSQERKRLGDKRSLTQQIHEITGIPASALQGASLSQFAVKERLSWIGQRQTKLEEDKAYSLQGIFDVYIAPIYKEGTARAFQRLMDEIDKLEKCIQDLRLTDPRDDKRRIEDTKGLMEDSYRWILENPDFQQWHDSEHRRLLWIKGDPGKGKTMLLCGIINELKKSIPKTDLLSYFYCQATDSRINSATTVLRGLLYLIISQQPSLASHVRKKYDYAGKTIFEDANAWVALTEIFADVLLDPSLNTIYLIIDALDECVTDLPKLLNFIIRHSSASSRIKWIISSRNSLDIEERLERAGSKVRLSLELNAECVSMAVNIFIEQKVSQLAQQKKYDERTRNAVLEHLALNANNTFLWVALVCQNLEATLKRNVLKKLNLFPPGLDSLYGRMMKQISQSDDAELCKQILASVTLVYQPITLDELAALVEQLEDKASDPESIRDIISLCGSFITLQEETIYFVHQSAKDFLLARAAKVAFPSGRENVHYTIFVRSLKILSRTLRRDMYGLKALGYPIKDVKQPDLDPLAGSRYSCIYWVDHLCDSNVKSSTSYVDSLHDEGVIDVFLRGKYLYWLEGLSLCKSIPKGIVSMVKLWLLVQGREDITTFNKLVDDARRFIMYHKGAIESSPLQAYASALLFSPTGSLIRRLFQHEEPKWISIKPAMGDSWGACLLTLEGHSHLIQSVAFSHNSTQLASASSDKTVKIWDANSGACLQTLEGHHEAVLSVAFSHDSTRLASASPNRTVKIWDTSSGACLRTLEGHSSNWFQSVAFSHDLTRLASASDDRTVKIWDTSSGACLQTLEGYESFSHQPVALSNDLTRLASASDDRTVKIWDTNSGACLQTLKGHGYHIKSVAFSHESTQLASASRDRTVKIWDTSSGARLHNLRGHSDWVCSVAFSHDSTQLASASRDRTVKIWDTSSGACLQTLEGHSHSIRSVTFSHDSTRLASASEDRTVKIWDTSISAHLQILKGHSHSIRSMAFSHDLAWLASASDDRTIKIWDISSGACLQTLTGHQNIVLSVAFSYDSTQLASVSSDDSIKIWDASSGECLQTRWTDKRICNLSFDPTGLYFHTEFGPIPRNTWARSSTVMNVSAVIGAALSIVFGTVFGTIISTILSTFISTVIGIVTSLVIGIVTTIVKIMVPGRLQYLDAGVSSDNTWITHGGKNILWVPSEYRASCSTVSGKDVGIGVGSGRVWICSFDLNKSEDVSSVH